MYKYNEDGIYSMRDMRKIFRHHRIRPDDDPNFVVVIKENGFPEAFWTYRMPRRFPITAEGEVSPDFGIIQDEWDAPAAAEVIKILEASALGRPDFLEVGFGKYLGAQGGGQPFYLATERAEATHLIITADYMGIPAPPELTTIFGDRLAGQMVWADASEYDHFLYLVAALDVAMFKKW